MGKRNWIRSNSQDHWTVTVVVLAGLAGPLLEMGELHAATLPPVSSVPVDVETKDFRQLVVLAAEVKTNETGPKETASSPGKPDTADPKVAERQAACEKEWEGVDTDHNGILEGGEIQRYNESFRAKSQPVLEGSDRLTRATFVAACLTLDAHE